MDIFLKIVIILALLGITLQDFKERNVFLWLLLLSGLSMGALHFKEVYYQQFILTTLINFSIIIAIVFVLFIYAKTVLNKDLKSTFGLGDFLFFIVLVIGFPTATFLVLFSFSLVFSLLLYFLLKHKLKLESVPLAGMQALFIGVIFIVNWIFNIENLYVI
ncbi:MAG: hypothetical protein ACOH1N_10340 [Lutibacter sp.]